MITPELVRWHAALLSDGTTGLNVVAKLVPRAIGDVEPPDVVVFNAVDNNGVARGAPITAAEVDPDAWVLTVGFASSLSFGRAPEDKTLGDATLMLVLTGIPDDAQDAAAFAAAYRIMRAARYCLHHAWLPYERDGLVLDQQRFTIDGDATVEVARIEGNSNALVGLAMPLPYAASDHWLFSPIP